MLLSISVLISVVGRVRIQLLMSRKEITRWIGEEIRKRGEC